MQNKMHRVQEVVLRVLRDNFSDPSVKFGSWAADVDYRTYPYVNIRRLSGLPTRAPAMFDRPVIEMTVYCPTQFSESGMILAENIYLEAREIIQEAVAKQTVVSGAGHLHSFYETFGPTIFDSPIEDTWRVQGLIQLGLRPPKSP